MSEDSLLFKKEILEEYAFNVLVKIGVNKEDAKYWSSALIEAHLRGVDTHGLIRLPAYVDRLIKGAMNIKPDMKIVHSQGSVSILDADNGSGFLAARTGMKIAVDNAREHGVGICEVFHSNHLGAAGHYARHAAESDMIGISMSTVYPLMGMIGAKNSVIGNNPMAFAVPTGGEYPFLFDISFSKVAQGNLIQAKQKGEKIPKDWAADSEGNATDDPEEGLKGFVLPAGGHKGFGLALIVEILCGVLSGGTFLRDMRSMYKHSDEESGVCHLLAAMDISVFMKKEHFYKRMQDFVESISCTEVNENQDKIRVPGYRAYLCKQERLKKGIPITNTLYKCLCDLSKRLGTPAF